MALIQHTQLYLNIYENKQLKIITQILEINSNTKYTSISDQPLLTYFNS